MVFQLVILLSMACCVQAEGQVKGEYVKKAPGKADPTSVEAPDLQAKVRGFIRRVDLASFPTGAHSEYVAGPASGLESAYLVLSRLPAGGSGPPLHTHPSDKIYFVLKGSMTVQLGTETFTAAANTLVMVPAATPHRVWNSGSDEEVHVEVMAPALGRLSAHAQPKRIANAASLLRKLNMDSFSNPAADVPGGDYSRKLAAKGFAADWLQLRNKHGTGYFAVNVVQSQPGSSGPPTHIHPFDQIYFVMEGTMTVQLGLNTYKAGPNTFVIIPAGMVHWNWNEDKVAERHLTFIVPEPQENTAWDVSVDIKGDVTVTSNL